MSSYTKDLSLQKTARIAGITFLMIVIGYTISWTFIYSKLIVSGNDVATSNNMLANELLLRMGIASDLLIAISGLILAWTLYVLLKPVNKNLALLAFILRLLDPIIAISTVSLSYISLQFLHGDKYSTIFNPEQLRALAGLFLNLHTSAATIPMVFTGLGFIIFFCLLLRTKYVPKILSGFGIFSYISILMYILAKIVIVTPKTNLLGNIELIFYSPSILFELIIGFWLLLRGVRIDE